MSYGSSYLVMPFEPAFGKSTRMCSDTCESKFSFCAKLALRYKLWLYLHLPLQHCSLPLLVLHFHPIAVDRCSVHFWKFCCQWDVSDTLPISLYLTLFLHFYWQCSSLLVVDLFCPDCLDANNPNGMYEGSRGSRNSCKCLKSYWAR